MTIGFLGCGNMGTAIARALANRSTPPSLVLYDVDRRRQEQLAAEIAAENAASLEDMVLASDITVLAVKPQILPGLYPSLASIKQNHRYISIAAGVSLATLQEKLHSKQVIRFMPNIAASVGESVTAVAAGSEAEQEFADSAMEIAQSCGTAFPLSERQFSAFTGISGSAIAFFYQFLHAIASGGTLEGIPYDQALAIASRTFSGALSLGAAQSTFNPSLLIANICSAGGTTIEGMYALEEGAFSASVMRAVRAASRRADELERS
jgi:pyrroline-5-carboxylate reductase